MSAITDDIGAARTRHVVYFLLTAYIEARAHGNSAWARDMLAALPLKRVSQVEDWLRLLRRQVASAPAIRARTAGAEEAGAVFGAAYARLVALDNGFDRSTTGSHDAALTARLAAPEPRFARAPPAPVEIRRRVYQHRPVRR